MAGIPAGDPHAYAVQAEANLEKLATELARLGVDENTVKSVSTMADMTRKLVGVLGKGQAQTGDDEPPAEQQPRPTLDSAVGDVHQAMYSQR